MANFASAGFLQYSDPFLSLNNIFKWYRVSQGIVEKLSWILILSRSGGKFKNYKSSLNSQPAKTTNLAVFCNQILRKSQFVHLIPPENQNIFTVRVLCFLDQFIHVYFQQQKTSCKVSGAGIEYKNSCYQLYRIIPYSIIK